MSISRPFSVEIGPVTNCARDSSCGGAAHVCSQDC